jgi:hypothetical protein
LWPRTRNNRKIFTCFKVKIFLISCENKINNKIKYLEKGVAHTRDIMLWWITCHNQVLENAH